MAKFPYGGIEFDPEEKEYPAWAKLATIQEHLESGEVVPPYLATWLGEAIQNAGQDPNTLVQNLGLKKKRGAPGKYPAKIQRLWGERIYDLLEQDTAPEAAISRVVEEYLKEHGPENLPERSTFQRWASEYAQAAKDARSPD
ncbi:hypothetical protein [Haliea sp.]